MVSFNQKFKAMVAQGHFKNDEAKKLIAAILSVEETFAKKGKKIHKAIVFFIGFLPKVYPDTSSDIAKLISSSHKVKEVSSSSYVTKKVSPDEDIDELMTKGCNGCHSDEESDIISDIVPKQKTNIKSDVISDEEKDVKKGEENTIENDTTNNTDSNKNPDISNNTDKNISNDIKGNIKNIKDAKTIKEVRNYFDNKIENLDAFILSVEIKTKATSLDGKAKAILEYIKNEGNK